MGEATCQATYQHDGGGIHWCDLPAGHDRHHVCCRCGSAWEDDR